MKTKPIFKTGSSPSYKGYDREVYMSEYVTIPKTRYRRMIISEVVGWGISAFLLLVTLIK
jgi:uncharacterized membrane protein (GlpM family)